MDSELCIASPNAPTLPEIRQRFPTAELVVRYGSVAPGSDVDLLIIVPAGMAAPVYDLPTDALDAFVLDRAAFEERYRAFEPEVTEPILTGSTLLGDPTVHRRAQRFLRSATVPRAASLRLRLLGIGIAHAGRAFHHLHPEPRSLQRAMVNATFALSYAAFASRYERNPSGAATLTEVIGDGRYPHLAAALAFNRYAKREPSLLTCATVRGWLNRAFDALATVEPYLGRFAAKRPGLEMAAAATTNGAQRRR